MNVRMCMGVFVATTLSLLWAGQGAWAEPVPSDLTVATWNLLWFFDEDPSDSPTEQSIEYAAPTRAHYTWKVREVAAAIASMNPTIIGLQEVEDRDALEDLVGELKEMHGLDYMIGYDPRLPRTEDYDVAVLAKSGLKGVHRGDEVREGQSETLRNIHKSLIAEFEWGDGPNKESLFVVVAHFVPIPAAREIERWKQGNTIRTWIEPMLASGEHVIVMGDFNTQIRYGNKRAAEGAVGGLQGLQTASRDDDLTDLSQFLVAEERATFHSFGFHFDRLLVSQSLAGKANESGWSIKSFRRRRDLVQRGELDMGLWTIEEHERDLSDHDPLVATFELN